MIKEAEMTNNPQVSQENEYLVHQAEELGLEARSFETLYRLDFRTPDAVREGGLRPNPRKPRKPLLDHVREGSDGSGSYVSATFNPDNIYFINKFQTTCRVRGKQVEGTLTSELEEQLTSQSPMGYDAPLDNIPLKRRTRVYQYELAGCVGVEVGSVGIPEEEEITIELAKPEQITGYREVDIVDRFEWEYQEPLGTYMLIPVTETQLEVGKNLFFGEFQRIT